MRQVLRLNGAAFTLGGAIFVFGVAQPIAAPEYNPALDPLASAIVSQAFRLVQMAPPAFWQEPSEPLAAAEEFWPQAHDTLLASSDWSFASAFAFLSAVDLGPDTITDDALPFTYRLPGDLVQVRELGSPGFSEWRIDGPWLRTNAPPPLRLRYTSRVTNPALLPPSYRHAVALELAVLLAPQWLGRTPEMMVLMAAAAAAQESALALDGRGQASPARYTPEVDMENDWATEAVA